MNPDNHLLYAYVATLTAIVVLAIGGAVVCTTFDGTDAQLAKVIAALAFIGGAITGLIGVIGTFRPRSPSPVPADQNGGTS